MPVVRITIAAVSDEGDTVVVWGRPGHAFDDGEPIGFVFEAKIDVGLAERASRLACGDVVIIDATPVADGWNRACGLTIPDESPVSGQT